MTETEKVVGIVSAVSEAKGGVLIDSEPGMWFNAEENCAKFVKGDLKGKKVELTLSKGNKFSFIRIVDAPVGEQVKAAVTQAAATGGVQKPLEPITPWGAKDRQIVRQTCVKAATELVCALVSLEKPMNQQDGTPINPLNPVDIIKSIAGELEEWVMRK